MACLTCAETSSSCLSTDGSERSVWDCFVHTTAARLLASDALSLSRPSKLPALPPLMLLDTSAVLQPSSGLPAGRVSAESIAGRECAVSSRHQGGRGLQHTCPQQAAGFPGGCLSEVEGSASALLQPVLLHCACSGAGAAAWGPQNPKGPEQHTLASHVHAIFLHTLNKERPAC